MSQNLSWIARLSLGVFVLTSFTAVAAQPMDAIEFHELLRSGLKAEWQNNKALSRIHVLPDENIMAAGDAKSLEEAVRLVNKSSLTKMVLNTEKQKLTALNADEILSQKPMTVVIVPGIFGEFINVRGFEEIFAKSAADQEAFHAIVERAKAVDETLSFSTLKREPIALDKVVHVGSIRAKDGKILVKVVLFFTGKYSLESLGTLEEHAHRFNERLGKYLDLTGQQDLLLVGYSRGTDTALEMLAQAKKENRNWLPSIKGMVSLGGVTWGSSLADNASPIIESAQTLRKELDSGSFTNTVLAWTKFGVALAKGAPQTLKDLFIELKSTDLRKMKSPEKPVAMSLNFTSVTAMIRNSWEEFGLAHSHEDFDINVTRFKGFLGAVLSGVVDLKSESRKTWWRENTLPNTVNYYALAAVVADPKVDKLNEQIFNGPYGFSNSFDDTMLLRDHRNYTRISGIALNDSQVSVAQVMFLPNYQTQLNTNNSGLRTAFLGIALTHHWGLALKVVNEMQDGRLNPYPREALLKALAAKVSLDLQK